MIRARSFALSIALFVLAASVAEASWYDDYDSGLAAARKGNWSVVVQKMSAAIKGNGKEENKARTYGVNFINYHPYYYRGVANLNLGNYEAAIADFERTTGPGPENLGSLDTLMERAKKQLAAASEPAPEPVKPAPEPVRPTVPTPTVPQIDPALRSRASGALNATKTKLQAAQTRRATGSPQYVQAMQIFTDATTRIGTARSNDDYHAVIDMAENAATLAELAMPPAVAQTPATITPTITPKPDAAASIVMSDYTRDVRRALQNYFAGEFETATQEFQRLTKVMPNNAWIWAFLGASQYSVYAFEADEAYRDAALASFRKAKQSRTFRNGLPEKYFSKRIRNAFAKTAS